MNIVEPILFQCKFNAPASAICTPGSATEALTYGDLERAIHNVARTALERGLAPGMTVAIAVKEALFHAVLALGLIRLGIVTTSGASKNSLPHLHVDAVISDVPRVQSRNERILLADSTWAEGDGIPLNYDQLAQFSEDDLCLISMTSGTTGEPKAIGLSHRMLHRRMSTDLYSKGPLSARTAPSYCDFGIGTQAGFGQMLSQLWRGSTIYFLGTDSSAILDGFARNEIKSMAVAPFGLGEFMRVFENEPSLTCNLDYILCMGAAISNQLAERVRARMCQNLYSWYATSEAGIAAFGPLSGLARVPGAVGYVVPGVTVEIANASGQSLPVGREGEIRVRSPVMVNDYLGDPVTSAEFFRDGFFYSGDLGCLAGDNTLVLTGRKKTILNLGGHKVKPEIVEDVLMKFPGIQEAAVFSLPDEFGIEVPWALLTANSPLNEAALRTHCADQLVDIAVPARFIMVDHIPRSPTGKIERHRLRDFAAGPSRRLGIGAAKE